MTNNNRSQTITFRLSKELCDAIDVLAAAQGISRGHWARGQVLAAVSKPNKDDLEAVLNDLLATDAKINRRLKELERALVAHLYYTLTRAGSVEHAVAETLAKEKLFPGGL